MKMSSRLPTWNMDDTAETRVMAVLTAAPGGLTETQIIAAIALWRDVGVSEALLGLVLDGRLTARFTGGAGDNVEDSALYEFMAPAAGSR